MLQYKVWVHTEGVNEEGDCVEGDEFYEPRQAGSFDTAEEAERFRDGLLDREDKKGADRTASVELSATVIALRDVLKRLLDTPDLNLDELEPETRNACDLARSVLDASELKI